MKKYIFLLLFGTLSAMSYSQVSVSYSAGYGLFNLGKMNDVLKDRVELLRTNLGSASLIKEFSNTMVHTFGVQYTMGREEYGFQISYASTKSEISMAQPISASTTATNIDPEKSTLTALRFGTLFRYHFLEFPINKNRKISLYGEISPGITIGSLSYNNVITFIDKDGNTTRDDLGGSSVSLSILPKVGVKTDIIKKVSLHVAAGYDLSLSGSIENFDDTPLQWSGVRAEAGVSYTF